MGGACDTHGGKTEMYKQYCWRNLNTRSRSEYLRGEVGQSIPVAARSFGSAAARLLGLRVRILPVAWMFVSCEYCVLSLVQRTPIEYGASECNLKTSNSEEAQTHVCLLSHEERRTKKGRQDNITMLLQAIGQNSVDWMRRAQDQEKEKALVNMMTNLWVP